MKVCGIDPGFANIGLSMLELDNEMLALIDTKLILTKPNRSETNKFKDELRRLADITKQFISFLDKHQPDLIISEDPCRCMMRRNDSYMANPATLKLTSMSWGAFYAISVNRSIKFLSVSALDIKQAITGNRSASKTDMQDSIQKLFGSYLDWPNAAKDLNKYNLEHVCDSIGAVITGLRDQ